VLKRRGAELPQPVMIDLATRAAGEGPHEVGIDGKHESPQEADL